MPPTLTFRLLTACHQSSDRGIGFLEGHTELDAGAEFDAFEKTNIKAYRKFRAHMDEWLDGADGRDTHFHRFKADPDHRNCFVFKNRQYHKHYRLYGFTCHPKDTDVRFELCVLCIYATKNEHQSDKAELDRVEQWHSNLGARQAIAKIYPPKKPTQGGSRWRT